MGVPEYSGERDRSPVVAVVLPGCSADEAIQFNDGTDDRVAHCARYGSNADFMAFGAISESSLTEADVPPEVAATLRMGGMILSDSLPVRGGVVQVVLGTASGQQSGQRVVDRVIKIRALVVSTDVLLRAHRLPTSAMVGQQFG